jgi:hypothetical protein
MILLTLPVLLSSGQMERALYRQESILLQSQLGRAEAGQVVIMTYRLITVVRGRTWDQISQSRGRVIL